MRVSARFERIGLLRSVTAIFILGIMTLAGCSGPATAGGPRTAQRFGPGAYTTEAISAAVIDFSDDHVARVYEATETLIRSDPESSDRAYFVSIALGNAYAAYDIAAGTNPIIGLTDMIVMTSLSRESVRRAAIDRTLTAAERLDPASYDLDEAAVEQLFTPQDRLLYLAFSRSDEDIRRVAAQVFWPGQFEQLDGYIAAWWERNPARRRVWQVRLDDFVEYRGATVQTRTGGPQNLLGLLYLDPFAGMDPTTREIAQSRMLAERVSFRLSRMPLIISLHARQVMYESMNTSELVSLRNTAEGVGATANRLADAVDRLPSDVATERDAALRQVADIIEVERDEAIRQFAEALATEREAAILDLESAVARQRDETFAALDAQSEQLQGTLGELNAALESANALAASATDTVRAVDDMDIENFQRLIESANESVASVERSIGAVERLAAPGAIDTQASGIDQSVTVAAESMSAVIDQAFRRGAMLIALLLVGWVIAALTIRAVGPRLARSASSA